MKQRRATHAQSRQRPEPSTAGRLGRPRRLEPVLITRPAWRSPTSGFLRLRSRPSHCSSRTVVWSGTKRCVVQNSRGHVGRSPDPIPNRSAHPPYPPPRAGCRWSSSTNRGRAVYRFSLSRGWGAGPSGRGRLATPAAYRTPVRRVDHHRTPRRRPRATLAAAPAWPAATTTWWWHAGARGVAAVSSGRGRAVAVNLGAWLVKRGGSDASRWSGAFQYLYSERVAAWRAPSFRLEYLPAEPRATTFRASGWRRAPRASTSACFVGHSG
jgi:hypothetical protein